MYDIGTDIGILSVIFYDSEYKTPKNVLCISDNFVQNIPVCTPYRYRYRMKYTDIGTDKVYKPYDYVH